ncbi:MAG: penicillin acylase family protein [Alphaproteobacteria bacterium]|nr:penicillin acylase family protein [Alphaproteobacteria bacterium]
MSRHLILLSLLVACSPDETKDGDTDSDVEPSPLLDVAETESWTLEGLESEGYVVYTDMGVPHAYARTRADLGRIVGFTLARDRFFYMDVASRLALGEVSALLGGAALDTDTEQRQYGATHIADYMVGLLDADPEMGAYFDGVAVGVNAYIEAVRAGELDAPSEYDLAAALLGKSEAVDLMTPWDRRRVVGGLVTVLYQSGFETKDMGRARDAARLTATFDGAPLRTEREAGLYGDVWGRVEPPNLVAQAPDWAGAGGGGSSRRSFHVPVELDTIERLYESTQRMEKRLGHEWVSGFGSNAWAVSAGKSADGRAMVATDGHLDLSVPPLFYQIGIDTKHLGGGDIQQVGMMTPAAPLISTGTNGDVAFGQTQLIGDITDWYAERLDLDANGAPVASHFGGDRPALLAFTEVVDVAVVPPPIGDGKGGPFTFTRYTTFDGRWIASIEGDEVAGPEAAGPGQTPIYLGTDWIAPRDVDGDGFVTAISFDYAGFDLSNMARTMSRYAETTDLAAFKEATADLVAYSLNLVAADRTGSIFYTGFQAVPCRGYLKRNPDGSWADGADPNLLLNGWEYGGFTIPITDDGRVDFGQGADPYKCVVPYEDYPHSRDPAQGFVVSANNDPGGFTFDGSLTDDPVYIGGPWMEAYRADEITRELTARAADGGISMDDMKEVQGNHTSVLGRQLVPELLRAIGEARAIAAGAAPTADTTEARILALWQGRQATFEEVEDRLEAWRDRGFQAESGVETFYETPTADEKADAVATMIFNVWMKRYTAHTVDDEGFPGLGWPTGDTGKFRVLTRMLTLRGPAAKDELASWYAPYEESVYFDIKSTPEIESSEEVALLALDEALDYLEGPAGTGKEVGHGGFGTADMDQWLWGMRHWVRMVSLLGGFFGLDDEFSFITDPFNITPRLLPLADGLPSSDPRSKLPGFPRHADNLCVDAANSGSGWPRGDGEIPKFDSDYGAAWRLVVALGGDQGFEAYNVIPGGQSGILESEHFADQAALWVANDYLPVQLYPEDVAAAGTARITFKP